MRVSLLGWGSRGDVQPLVALGRQLVARGHEVSVAVPRNLTGLVASAGLTAVEFGIDMDQAIASDVGRAWLEGGSRGRVTEARLMSDVVAEFAPVAAEGIERLIEGTDAMVSGLLTHDAALSVADERGLGHVLALLAPLTPTRSGAATMFPVLPGRRSPVNLLATRLVELGFRHLIALPGDLARRRLGLRRLGPVRYGRLMRRTPVLLGASRHVVPPPPEWRGRVLVTGYWVPDLPVDAPQDLRAFLAAGPPPVYLGFGSMPVSDPERRWALIEQTVAATGMRAVVHLGGTRWRPDRSGPGSAGAGIALAEDVPHEWLFPQTAAVVHHGGAGTTAAAVRAGVPQVVVPHMGDQPYWARRMTELGVAPAPLPFHRLDAAALTGRLRQVRQPAFTDRARALAGPVRAEGGAAEAARALTALWPVD